LPLANASFKALAFQMMAKTRLLLENFGSSSRLLFWKMTGRQGGRRSSFAKDIHTLVKNAFGYKGEIMDGYPPRGWLLYGQLW